MIFFVSAIFVLFLNLSLYYFLLGFSDLLSSNNLLLNDNLLRLDDRLGNRLGNRRLLDYNLLRWSRGRGRRRSRSHWLFLGIRILDLGRYRGLCDFLIRNLVICYSRLTIDDILILRR